MERPKAFQFQETFQTQGYIFFYLTRSCKLTRSFFLLSVKHGSSVYVITIGTQDSPFPLVAQRKYLISRGPCGYDLASSRCGTRLNNLLMEGESTHQERGWFIVSHFRKKAVSYFFKIMFSQNMHMRFDPCSHFTYSYLL